MTSYTIGNIGFHQRKDCVGFISTDLELFFILRAHDLIIHLLLMLIPLLIGTEMQCVDAQQTQSDGSTSDDQGKDEGQADDYGDGGGEGHRRTCNRMI